ncbi:hypothetical protein K402DRAFT_397263 [Aulographum hederae CBS 113979]|uniref:Uncharacterized protein n=1 Tax=Aulographum hederae CBS 113979 TaxID=1176131 RepID=A0A6G1GP75_9PEZI|nr:hypothetical protein K402DRAFT_397263 [Aulographum hederae CBS 113979]
MSAEYQGQDPLKLAEQAEKELGSYEKTHGGADYASKSNNKRSLAGDSTNESGVDDTVTSKFPGAEVTYGSAASGAGDNREIPLSEGGDIDPKTGRLYKARDYEGEGGPEDKERIYAEEQGGNDDVRGNVRQGQEGPRR